jgi:hypothetical protein
VPGPRPSPGAQLAEGLGDPAGGEAACDDADGIADGDSLAPGDTLVPADPLGPADSLAPAEALAPGDTLVPAEALGPRDPLATGLCDTTVVAVGTGVRSRPENVPLCPSSSAYAKISENTATSASTKIAETRSWT